MSRPFLTVTIVAIVAAAVSAQNGTADGVAALARGDYQRAVEILKPIAEDWRSDDTAAQFFMAGLYEHGKGVAADPLRACALYARAASKYDTPFGRQANPIFATLIGRGQEFNDECQLLANIGFDTGFEPATFDLGPGHSVEWTLSAATVTYEGRTKRTAMPLAGPGARFLPLQHTELSTGPTRSLTRHFIEVFLWTPTGRSGPWNLQWHCFEIVRDEIIRIDTTDALATVEGDGPPSTAFDVRDYAAVRVDDDGNAEWAVLKGPHTGSGRIESDAERREARDARVAQDAALKQVDWKRRSDVYRRPAMTYAESDGCGLIQLYGWTLNRDEVIVVRANTQELGMLTQSAAFDLSRSSSNISIETYVYDAARRGFDFCSDVRILESGAIEPEVWRAIAGTITIEMSPAGTRSRPRATVTLTNVVLRNAAGTLMRAPGPIRLSATVGWFAG
jgi:hypothetical protein